MRRIYDLNDSGRFVVRVKSGERVNPLYIVWDTFLNREFGTGYVHLEDAQEIAAELNAS
jgi:hypothetical protein